MSTENSESLKQHAVDTLDGIGFSNYFHTLIASWTEVGESAQSQKNFINDLCVNVQEVLSQAVNAAETRKGDIEQLIIRKIEVIDGIKEKLAEAVDTTSNEYKTPGTELTLIQRLNEVGNIESKLNEQHVQWVDKLTAKRDRAAGMCQMLGLTFDENLQQIGALTSKRLASYDKYIDFLSQTQTERKQIISECKASIMEYWKILETVPATHLEKSIADEACDLGVHVEVIEALQQMKADLNVEYQSREAETAQLGDDIQRLWNLLEIDEKFQQYFSDKNGGIGLRAVEACRDERERLLIKKEKLLPRIIAHERAQFETF
jgi:hypothetical protein